MRTAKSFTLRVRQ